MGRGEPLNLLIHPVHNCARDSNRRPGKLWQAPAVLRNPVRARRGDAFPGAQQQRTWTTLTSSSGFATVTLLIGRCTVRPAFLTPDPYQQEPKLKSTQPSLHPSTGRRLMT